LSHLLRRARSFQSRQRPGLETATNGDFFLGDFGLSLVEVEGLQLDHEAPPLLSRED
jgi:hypothetical protein